MRKGSLSPAAAILLQEGFSLAQIGREVSEGPWSADYISRMLRGQRRLRPELIATIARLAGPHVADTVVAVVPGSGPTDESMDLERVGLWLAAHLPPGEPVTIMDPEILDRAADIVVASYEAMIEEKRRAQREVEAARGSPP